MPRSAPSFPVFDEWQKMSESEQDALLDRLEAAKRRSALATLLMISFGSATLAVATGLALLTLW